MGHGASRKKGQRLEAAVRNEEAEPASRVKETEELAAWANFSSRPRADKSLFCSSARTLRQRGGAGGAQRSAGARQSGEWVEGPEIYSPPPYSAAFGGKSAVKNDYQFTLFTVQLCVVQAENRKTMNE